MPQVSDGNFYAILQSKIIIAARISKCDHLSCCSKKKLFSSISTLQIWKLQVNGSHNLFTTYISEAIFVSVII